MNLFKKDYVSVLQSFLRLTIEQDNNYDVNNNINLNTNSKHFNTLDLAILIGGDKVFEKL